MASRRPSLPTCPKLTWISLCRIFCERLSISTMSTTAIEEKVRSKIQRLCFDTTLVSQPLFQSHCARYSNPSAGHCLDMIRQQLMCTADTGFLGQIWIAGHEPFVDFNTKHKCRHFEAIRQWAEYRQIRDLPPDYLAKPQPGDEIWPDIP